MPKQKTKVPENSMFVRNFPIDLRREFHSICIREGITMQKALTDIVEAFCAQRRDMPKKKQAHA